MPSRSPLQRSPLILSSIPVLATVSLCSAANAAGQRLIRSAKAMMSFRRIGLTIGRHPAGMHTLVELTVLVVFGSLKREFQSQSAFGQLVNPHPRCYGHCAGDSLPLAFVLRRGGALTAE